MTSTDTISQVQVIPLKDAIKLARQRNYLETSRECKRNYIKNLKHTNPEKWERRQQQVREAKERAKKKAQEVTE